VLIRILWTLFWIVSCWWTCFRFWLGAGCTTLFLYNRYLFDTLRLTVVVWRSYLFLILTMKFWVWLEQS